jgi:menaquinone-dependent protoporphyrinogen oxidase
MLVTILVTFASKHGWTRGIAERVAAELEMQGAVVELRSIDELGLVTGYDAVVVGSAVYYGSWLKEAAGFVRRNRNALAERPVWLFSSGPVGDTVLPPPKEMAEFKEAITPRDHRVFAGGLDRRQLGMTERLATKMVRAPEGDYRDWDQIVAWADGIASALSSIPSGSRS